MCDLPPLGPAKDRPFCRLPPSPAHPVPPRASTAVSKSADRGTFSRTDLEPSKERAACLIKKDALRAGLLTSTQLSWVSGAPFDYSGG